MHSQPQQPNHHPHPRQYHEPPSATPRPDLKRKAYELGTTPAPSNNKPGKRPRTSEKAAEIGQDPYPAQRTPRSLQHTQEPQVDRTIPFEDIYQNGKAQYKHKIFEHKPGSNNWFIVRCDEHQVHFGHGNPLHGAAKHVHSPQHGNLEKKHELALQVCGHRITGCNADLARLNNQVFHDAVKEEGYVPFNMNLLTKEGRRRHHDGAEVATKPEGHVKVKAVRLNINSDEANNVQDCNFYQGLWSPTKKWYTLVVLPILPDGSLRDAGLPQISLGETDLMDKVPLCYSVDRNSLQIKEWRAAYKSGGDKVDKREYPVMFFDGAVKNSLGWLPASKLKPLDLDHPPDDVDKRGLAAARMWFAQKMMYRNDWEDYKNRGPGQPPSSEGGTNKHGEIRSSLSIPVWMLTGITDQVPSLRSLRGDAQSPIRDKSNKPEGFSASSSEEGSDEEDSPKVNTGPVPEPTNAHYVGDSSSELSDVDLGSSQKSEEIGDEILAKHASGPEGIAEETAEAGGTSADPGEGEAQSTQPQTSPEVCTLATGTETTRPALPRAESDHEQQRKDAQARAAAAAVEAVSRSRASSEVPEGASSHQEAQLHRPLRPNGLEHHRRSASDNNLAMNFRAGLTMAGSQLGGVRKASDLRSILNQDHTSTVPVAQARSIDPYKRAEAIAAQMEGLKSRAASAPMHESKGTASPFPPPPLPLSQGQQRSPPVSHIMSPPVQSPVMMPPRSSSSTPVQAEVGRSSPQMVSMVPSQDKWQAVRSSHQTSQTSTRASFVNTTSAIPSRESTPKGVTQPPMSRSSTTPSARLGTPVSEKQENFDVSQLRDSARGVRWSREGPDMGFLRLATDATRGWAETVKGSPLTARVEAARIVRIEVDALDGDNDKERVNLVHKDGNQQTLVFETNSENQRLMRAAVQRRRFVTWLRKNNSSVEYQPGQALIPF